MLKEKLIAEFKEAIKNWKSCNGDDDKEMTKMYVSDRKDLRKILKLFKKEKYKEAYDMAWNLDTIVREQIPSSVYEIIEMEGE